MPNPPYQSFCRCYDAALYCGVHDRDPLPEASQPCCGQFATCQKTCVPRKEHLGARVHALAAADGVLKLVNQSPRTPGRAQIAEVIFQAMPAVVIRSHSSEDQMRRENDAYLRGCREAEEKHRKTQ